MLWYAVGKEDGKDDQARTFALCQCDDDACILAQVRQLDAQAATLQHSRQRASRQTLLAQVFDQEYVNAQWRGCSRNSTHIASAKVQAPVLLDDQRQRAHGQAGLSPVRDHLQQIATRFGRRLPGHTLVFFDQRTT
jgi:hypothetical protein